MANITFTGVFEDIEHDHTFEAKVTVNVHPAAGEDFEEFVDNVYHHTINQSLNTEDITWNRKVYKDIVEVINDYLENFEIYEVDDSVVDEVVMDNLDWVSKVF